MRHVEVDVDGKKAMGVEVALPKAPLVLVYGPQGFVMCGYLAIETADKLGVAAALVRGVASVNDLLEAPIQGVSRAAAAKGVTSGMTGRDALKKLI
jgi:uncharacterized protein YunC (DUF1805 family)